jgi:molecular chaperone GrpE
MNDTEETKIPDSVQSEETVIDDVVFEDTAEGEGEAHSRDKIKKLRDDLKIAQTEKTDYLTNWQKERADFINYKKGEDDRRKETLVLARERFTEELLPVLDAYDMAFSNKEAWEKVDKTWRTGVEYIHQQLVKVLAENGVSEIAPELGAMPDANLHESVDTIPTDDESKQHSIAQIMQKGYKMGSRVIRPARVKVWEKK